MSAMSPSVRQRASRGKGWTAVGFGREARRVRDGSLSHANRRRALATCIEFSRPVGYHATWSYMEAVLGRTRDEPSFLEPALGLLEFQRRWHVEIDKRYAGLRRLQKRRGRRGTAPGEVTATSPRRWHGDERDGAMHSLTEWLRRRRDEELAADPDGSIALSAAERVVATELPILDVGELQHCLDWARRQVNVVGWSADSRAYRKAWVALFLLGQVHLILNGRPAVGTVWNFVSSSRVGKEDRSAAWHLLKTPVGLWRSSPKGGTKKLIDVATGLLVLGHDSPALRELAGKSITDTTYEVEPVVHRLLTEIGLETLLDVSADRAGLEAQLEYFLDGDVSLRRLSQWAHSAIGHEGDEECQPFVLLDDIYDDWESAGHDLEYLDVTARRAAHDFLAGRMVTRFDWLTPPDRP